MRDLLDFSRDARSVCRENLPWTGRPEPSLVRLPHAVHTAAFSPSGGGKGTSLIIPFLLDCPESCVVVDFKGENASLTALHRMKEFGHRVIFLDPYHVATKTSDSYNPLDFIAADDPFALDHCDALAGALVVREPEERERHWGDSAEAWIGAVAAAVVGYGQRDESRSLQTVGEIVCHPQRLETAVRLMCESDLWGGMLARKGGKLLHYVDRERSSTLTTIGRHLRFLDTPAVAACTSTSTFHPAALRDGKMTVYLILPPEHLRGAQSALLRLWIGSLLRAVVQGGLGERNLVHFILDEAASLGRLEAIDDAVDKYRGFGVRLQFYYQSQAQLKRCFPEGQDVTLLSNATQIYFGCNTLAEAEQISGRLGESTIVVDSGGWSRGTSRQNSYGASPQQTSQGSSYNESRNWQAQARRLLKPEEVLQLPRRIAITFAPGLAPILTRLVPYYEEERVGRPEGRLKGALLAGWTLGESLLECLLALVFFSMATWAFRRYGVGGIWRLVQEQ